MTRQRVGVSVVIGLLLAIAVVVLLVRCPWSACRYLNLNTYTITTLQSIASSYQMRQRLRRCTAWERSGWTVPPSVTMWSPPCTADALCSGSEQGIAKTETAKPGLLRAPGDKD